MLLYNKSKRNFTASLMMIQPRKLLLLFWLFASGYGVAQTTTPPVPFDPYDLNSRATFDAASNYFLGGHRFYSVAAGFHYGFAKRSLLSVTVPVVHTIFNADYAGFENTTGIGDLRFGYAGAVYLPSKKGKTIEKVSAVLDVTAPTGEEAAGRGTGAWVFKPGLAAAVRFNHFATFYPEARFQLSAREANSRGGTDGLPDPEDPQTDERLQNFSVQLPFAFELVQWGGWVSFNVPFTYSFNENDYFLFLRADFGKKFSDKAAASLFISRWVAGQPRLNTTVQARFIIFL